jgi:hypothetical protein
MTGYQGAGYEHRAALSVLVRFGRSRNLVPPAWALSLWITNDDLMRDALLPLFS